MLLIIRHWSLTDRNWSLTKVAACCSHRVGLGPTWKFRKLGRCICMGCLCSAIPHNLPLGDRGIHLWDILLMYLLSDLMVGAALVLIKPPTTSLAASQLCRNSLSAEVRVWNICTAGAIPH